MPFVKGKSGNPSGGSKRPTDPLQFLDDKKICRLIEVFYRKALKGNVSSLKAILELVECKRLAMVPVSITSNPSSVLDSLKNVDKMSLDEVLKTFKTMSEANLTDDRGREALSKLTDGQLEELANWVKTNKAL